MFQVHLSLLWTQVDRVNVRQYLIPHPNINSINCYVFQGFGDSFVHAVLGVPCCFTWHDFSS